jgi:hypothetical protein
MLRSLCRSLLSSSSPLRPFPSSSNTLFALLRPQTKTILSLASIFAVASTIASCSADEETKEEDDDEGNKEEPILISLEEVMSTPEEDAHWEAEKLNCSFCKQFLLSPCKEEFKLWSKCVDKAKSRELDYISACSPFTRALMRCTSDNADYFQKSMGEENKNDNEDSSEESEDNSGEKEGSITTDPSDTQTDINATTSNAKFNDYEN